MSQQTGTCRAPSACRTELQLMPHLGECKCTVSSTEGAAEPVQVRVALPVPAPSSPAQVWPQEGIWSWQRPGHKTEGPRDRTGCSTQGIDPSGCLEPGRCRSHTGARPCAQHGAAVLPQPRQQRKQSGSDASETASSSLALPLPMRLPGDFSSSGQARATISSSLSMEITRSQSYYGGKASTGKSSCPAKAPGGAATPSTAPCPWPTLAP